MGVMPPPPGLATLTQGRGEPGEGVEKGLLAHLHLDSVLRRALGLWGQQGKEEAPRQTPKARWLVPWCVLRTFQHKGEAAPHWC